MKALFFFSHLMQVSHRISLHGRSSAELQAFFANIFNTLALHA
jgi:hypothetical protein